MVVLIENILVIVCTVTWLVGLIGWRYVFRNGHTVILRALRWFINWDMVTVGVLIGLDLLHLFEVVTTADYLPLRRLLSPLGHSIALLGGLITLLREGSGYAPDRTGTGFSTRVGQ